MSKKSNKTKMLLGVSTAALMLAANPVINRDDSGKTWIEFGPGQASAFECANDGAGGASNDNGQATATACGSGATVNAATPFGIAIGEDANASAANAIAIGGNSANGGVGSGTNAAGVSSIAIGDEAEANGNGSIALGGDPNGTTLGAQANGVNSVAVGVGANTAGTATNGIAIGTSSSATGVNSTATGVAALATGANSFAAGANANATAAGSVAIGTDSAGNGAVSSLENQFVLGTGNQTYTAAGITSGLSRARQSGPLEVVTSDAAGNLATDGGDIFRRLDNFDQDVDRLESGVAVAMASVGPDLTGAERFGLSLNWGGFEGANAIGGGGTAVVWRGNGSRFAVTGGIGVGLDGEDAVGGRAGGQYTW